MRRYGGATIDELTPWANVTPQARDLIARVRELEDLLDWAKSYCPPEAWDKIDAALAEEP